MTTHKSIATFILAAFAAIGCEPGGIISESTDSLDVGDGDGDGDMATTGGDGDGDPGDGDGDITPTTGEAWGPCPTNQQGIPTLCYSEDLACVPADFGEANICLPIGGCPSDVPPFSTGFEIGWGGACYPRCVVDSDCGDGMVCGMSVDDNTPMCAWPRDPFCAQHPGSIGCPCPVNGCDDQLVCIDGACGPCPAGQLGCACEQGNVCDVDLACAVADNGATVCSRSSGDISPCGHGLGLPGDGIDYDGACVVECKQGDDCGSMTCSPIGPFSDGFCAWP